MSLIKSRYCPLQDLHSGEKDDCNACGGKPGFARSSRFRYSPHHIKSDRRRDPAVSDEDIAREKLRERIRSTDNGNSKFKENFAYFTGGPFGSIF